MNRRALLSSIALGTGLAGCLSGLRGSEPEPTVSEIDPAGTTPAPPLSSAERRALIGELEPEDAALAVEIGDGDGLHWILVVSEISDLETDVSVSTDDHGVVFEDSVTLSSDTYAAIRLERPDEYSIAVSSPEHGRSITVISSRVDCNPSEDVLLLEVDGGTSVWGETTDADCH